MNRTEYYRLLGEEQETVATRALKVIAFASPAQHVQVKELAHAIVFGNEGRARELLEELELPMDADSVAYAYGVAFRRDYWETAQLCHKFDIVFDGRQSRGAGKPALYQFTDHGPDSLSCGATFYLEDPTPEALSAALFEEQEKFTPAKRPALQTLHA